MKKLIKGSLNNASLLIMQLMIWNSKFSMLWQFASSILSFVVSMSQSSFKSSLTLKSLAVSLALGQLTFFTKSWSTFNLHGWAHLHGVPRAESLQNGSSVTILTVSHYCSNSIYIRFEFHSTFGFFTALHLYWPVPSRLPIFVKYHMSLSLGAKESTQLHALLSVQDPSNRCAVTCHQQALKEVRC